VYYAILAYINDHLASVCNHVLTSGN